LNTAMPRLTRDIHENGPCCGEINARDLMRHAELTSAVFSSPVTAIPHASAGQSDARRLDEARRSVGAQHEQEPGSRM